ncbi:MAG: Tol-Pal system beta propeller repeat protein TolB [Acidiferrobacteraceae bacterium]|jgi:TolB protein|nr:Tol-Pal system beta propeller repeat protein TolB [Acidiferrobacteraceae bacterium]MDP6398990.1 Tol-Pal system beta propeller repeat protein TolB [Arenicellales bacterium]MDP6550905.1 Tol-Pal system beta propeller repeat protein TolB [Arenicellales bacterium]MDP6790719.1 Tol-Pal system beta propeller repeat protein TolB [Arenicellales bacterium]MDP6917939.1 Tol-Pal system beta propeller repeat protein TolB [Arenicellales bacterium]|tara:strand:- start:3583 stop:4905 length:1323 start_codon:yes stop_codon:yes gene_type:complete
MKGFQKALVLLFAAATAFILPGRAAAALTIEITQGGRSGTPIAAVPFHWQGTGDPPVSLRSIIAADLHRSGRFELLPPSDFLSKPSEFSEVRYKDWRLIKAEVLVVGRIVEKGPDQFEVSFQLLDVYRERVKVGLRYSATAAQLRQVAHQISDRIFYEMTGIKGAFDTRIAYVTMQLSDGGDRIYQLMIADSDGHNAQQILNTTNLPVLSPAWSPNGQWLAYVSFSDGRSGANVWLQDISTGTRRPVARFDGAASAPAWSPDGKSLALTVAAQGNTDIYVLEVASGELHRLTKHQAIDTEPAWSPDGRYLVFTSDRSGRPQIYRVSRNGGKVERLTREGKENAGASYDPTGKRLVMVTNRGQGAGYQIGVFYPASGRTDVLTDGTLDESPTFSPNGAMILYATRLGSDGVLVAVSADGRVRQVLKLTDGDVREPAWSASR